MGAHAPFLGTDATEHVGLAQPLGDVVASFDRPDTFACGVEDARRKVRRQDLDRPSLGCGKMCGQDHRQGVGLLAGGAGGAPGANPLRNLAGFAEGAPVWQYRPIEKLKLFRFAKETGLVRGDAIEHRRPLVLIRLNVLVVGGKIAAAEGSHAPRQTSADQRLLRIGEMNPRLAVDELLQHPELAVGQRADGVGVVHGYWMLASAATSATAVAPAARISSEEKMRSMSSSRTKRASLVLAMPRRKLAR